MPWECRAVSRQPEGGRNEGQFSADFCSCFVKWPFIVSFRMKNGDFPVRYVKLPEGKQFCYCGSKLNKVEHTYTDSQKSA